MAILGPRWLADCHLHFEGSLPEDFLETMGRRSGHRFGEPGVFREARRQARTPAAFLDLYAEVCRLFRGPEDYGTAARAVALALTSRGLGYFEMYVSPEIPTRLGFDASACLREVAAALAQVEAEGGARGRILLDAVRQWGDEAAERVLDVHEATRLPAVVGFGMGGDENSKPASQFAGVYARARSLGLRTSVHAGEWGGPESVREALDALRPDRVDHGIAAASDPALLSRLVEEGTVLWVAPSGNVATGAVAGWAAHPLSKLLDAGVCVALSADDPLFFETSTVGEYQAAASRLKIPAEALDRMAENAWKGAFCTPAEHDEGVRGLRTAPPRWDQPDDS
jgi:adenosine deaminase